MYYLYTLRCRSPQVQLLCVYTRAYILYRLDDFCMFDHMISHVVVCYDMLFAVFGGVVNGHFVGTPSELVRP